MVRRKNAQTGEDKGLVQDEVGLPGSVHAEMISYNSTATSGTVILIEEPATVVPNAACARSQSVVEPTALSWMATLCWEHGWTRKLYKPLMVLRVACIQAEEVAREATMATAVALTADHPEPTAMVLRHLRL